MNKKGLTLIELLGVIVILGIIAAIAFPAINGTIENSRKDAFAANVNSFIEAAVNDARTRNLDNGIEEFAYYVDTDGNYFYSTADSTTTLDASKPSNAPTADINFTKPLGLKGGVVFVSIDNETLSITVTIQKQINDGRYFVYKATDVNDLEVERGDVKTTQETEASGA